MKQNDPDKKIIKLLSILTPMVYFASYLTRKDYSIVMEAIIQSEGLPRNTVGFIETLSILSYGSGQIISGFFGDRLRPCRMITIGLSVSILINFLMPPSPLALRGVLWFINGFAQSMLWPPLLVILSTLMDNREYESTAVNINAAGIFATLVVYLSSSLVWIGIFHNWKLTFFMNALIASFILALWLFNIRKIEAAMMETGKRKPGNEDAPKDTLPLKSFLLKSGFLLIALSILLQGMLRDGITDWLPSFIATTFHLSSGSAIFKSVLLPIIGILSLKLTGFFSRRFVKEESKASAFLFLAAALLCLFLLLSYSRSQYLTLFLSSLIVGIMHAINLFLVCIVPSRFFRYGMVSTMSGVVNSLTYVGSAGAIYGFGFLSENYGWTACIIAWILIAALGMIFCFAAVPGWIKFKKQKSPLP